MEGIAVELSRINKLLMTGNVNLAAATVLLENSGNSIYLRGWKDIFELNNRLRIVKLLIKDEPMSEEKGIIEEELKWRQELIIEKLSKNQEQLASEWAILNSQDSIELKMNYSKVLIKIKECDGDHFYSKIKGIEMM